jgi:hypothetical protein
LPVRSNRFKFEQVRTCLNMTNKYISTDKWFKSTVESLLVRMCGIHTAFKGHPNATNASSSGPAHGGAATGGACQSLIHSRQKISLRATRRAGITLQFRRSSRADTTRGHDTKLADTTRRARHQDLLACRGSRRRPAPGGIHQPLLRTGLHEQKQLANQAELS